MLVEKRSVDHFLSLSSSGKAKFVTLRVTDYESGEDSSREQVIIRDSKEFIPGNETPIGKNTQILRRGQRKNTSTPVVVFGESPVPVPMASRKLGAQRTME